MTYAASAADQTSQARLGVPVPLTRPSSRARRRRPSAAGRTRTPAAPDA